MDPIRKKYFNHPIFQTLSEIKEFYSCLSFMDFSLPDLVGTRCLNITSEIYQSIENTIDSIEILLKNYRLNDAAALVRKYNDAVMLSVYILLTLDDEKESFFKEKYVYESILDSWIDNKFNNETEYLLKKGDETVFSLIKKKDKKLANIFSLDKETYINGRKIGNDNLHYNFFGTCILNMEKMLTKHEPVLKYMDDVLKSLKLILRIHLSCIILLKPFSLCSSDYIDALEMGEEPDEKYIHTAAPYVEKVFKKYIEQEDKELANYLKKITSLKFDESK